MKREDRYLVIKLEDINKFLTPGQTEYMLRMISQIRACRVKTGKEPNKKYVVVAEDWPMYKNTWNAIERWVESDSVETSKLDICCPQCGSWSGLKFPRNSDIYCEDCGWPDEDFGEDNEQG